MQLPFVYNAAAEQGMEQINLLAQAFIKLK